MLSESQTRYGRITKIVITVKNTIEVEDQSKTN